MIPYELWVKPLSEDDFKPTIVDFSLHRSFWREYQLAVSGGEIFRCKDVYQGICSAANFYLLLSNANRLRWLLNPSINVLKSRYQLKEPLLYQIGKMLRKAGAEDEIKFGDLVKMLEILDRGG